MHKHIQKSNYVSTPESPKSVDAVNGFSVRSQPQADRLMTPEQIENQTFQQYQLEATQLQIQAKHGTITPEGQRKLGLLQAQMNNLLQAKVDKASRFGHHFANIAINPTEGNVVQPIQPKLTLGQPGDHYEQEADRTAAEVVSWMQSPNTSLSNQGQAVQRRDMPTVTYSIQRVSAVQPQFSNVVQRKGDDAKDETDASNDETKLASRAFLELATELDLVDYIPHTAWLNKLPSFYQEEIHGEFSFKNQEQRFQQLLNRDKPYQTKQREKRATKDKSKQQTIEDELKNRAIELRTQHGDKHIKPKGVEKSVVEIPEDGLRWDEGRTLARLNFVAYMTSVLGSIEAVKAHFMKVRPVKIAGYGIYLSDEAASRLETASKAFEGRYTGMKFPVSNVGIGLRNRHQQEHKSGLIGHPLGISLDFFAFENPHLKESRFLAETIGGGPAFLKFTNSKGEVLDFTARRKIIEKLGRETLKGIEPGQHHKEGEELLSQLDGAYAAMVNTSKQFQESLPPESKAVLQAEVEKYWSLRKKITDLNKSLEKSKDPRELEILKSLQALLPEVFKPYLLKIDEEIEKTREQFKDIDSLSGSPSAYDAAKRLRWIELGKARTDKQREAKKQEMRKKLQGVIKNFSKVFAGIDTTQDNPDDLKKLMEARIEAHYGRIRVEKLKLLRNRLLNDLDFVFGARRDKAFMGGNARQVENPSVLQLLELGFIVNNEEQPEEAATQDGQTEAASAQSKQRKRSDNKEF
ncbi:MAG TPA: hypothetical protein V6C91_13805, partial [Coleofasciculaceae cyanobacterium]